ncbi:MAG: hypothetical protein H6Q20_610 [Bacteroidetes bacterium]|nr:hypothetical protein [Bacteroidota bacterium]
MLSYCTFPNAVLSLQPQNTVVIAQLVRASDCGSEGRGFEPRFPPGSKKESASRVLSFFIFTIFFHMQARCFVEVNKFIPPVFQLTKQRF